jgi:hypothetical protein
MADVKDSPSGTSSASRAGSRVTERGGEYATGIIETVGDVLEDAVHAIGNVGVTTMREATRVLTTTALGIRQTIGSAVSGVAPDFGDERRDDTRHTR